VGSQQAEQADAGPGVWDRVCRQWEVLAELSSCLLTPTLSL